MNELFAHERRYLRLSIGQSTWETVEVEEGSPVEMALADVYAFPDGMVEFTERGERYAWVPADSEWP